MRTQGLTSTENYAPRANAGQIEFGLSNIIETTFAVRDGEMFEGRPNPDIRLALTLFPLPVTNYSPLSSNVGAPGELSGKKVPVGWTSQRLGGLLFEGFFANIDVPYESVAGVPVTAMPRMWDMYAQGQLDLAFGIFGSASTAEQARQVGGHSYISVRNDEEAIARMQQYLPGSYVSSTTDPDTDETVNNIAYDFVVYTGASVPEDIVYEVVKTVYENPENLAAASAYFERFDPAQMAKDQGLEYHPGAIRFYREAGIWPDS